MRSGNPLTLLKPARKILWAVGMAGFAAVSANAQVNLTSAVTFSYSQNFDTLA